MMRLAALGVLCALVATAWAGEGDESCLACHSDRAKLTEALQDKSTPIDRFFVDRERYARSVHASRGCAECHFEFDRQPHPKNAETVKCADCHDKEQKALETSVHGKAQQGKEKLPVACGACHGVHDIVKPTERDSPLAPLNIYRTCGKCHFSKDPAHSTVDELMKEPYTDDTHARGILKGGLTVAATCVSCHGGHEIKARGDPTAPTAREHVAKTCGKCHVGALEEYEKSIHHLKGEGEGHRGATCSDCHLPHEISEPTEKFVTSSVRACTRCHDQRAGSFRLTYHGKISSLGMGGQVATCEHCHGNHTILPASDPGSKIHPNHLVATCGQCHRNSHEEFASYLVHADPRDGERYPIVHGVYVVMNGLLVGTLILGGIHALLWLVRALAAGEWRRPAPPPGGHRYIRRWPKAFISFHIALMTDVLVLASTGLPLHFADKPWANGLMRLVGGPAVAGVIHRFAAIVLGILFVLYMAYLVQRIVFRRERGFFGGPDSMMPRWKDLQDFWGNLRWFFFLAPRPKYDRWTYWEKFDFWAAFWGLFVIGLSGLVLWFPERATKVLPGWFINVAIVVHGIEALLDIAFIFTVHVFHANLRPDKFPMDTMFLTGVLSEKEFRHERPEEYERAVREGTLETLLAEPPARKSRLTAYIIGACALGVGFFFVAMMLLAVLQNWR